MSILPWYVGLVFAMAEFFAMHHVSCTSFGLTPAHLQWSKDCYTRSFKQG
jgi:hypothetical protein